MANVNPTSFITVTLVVPTTKDTLHNLLAAYFVANRPSDIPAVYPGGASYTTPQTSCSRLSLQGGSANAVSIFYGDYTVGNTAAGQCGNEITATSAPIEEASAAPNVYSIDLTVRYVVAASGAPILRVKVLRS